jgi:hypothetical protein
LLAEAGIALAKTYGATAIAPGILAEMTRTDTNSKSSRSRLIVFILTSLAEGFGRVPERSGVKLPPKIQTVTSRTTTPGSKAVKIRYGPYIVPNMMTKNGLGEVGMLSNWPDEKVTK